MMVEQDIAGPLFGWNIQTEITVICLFLFV